MTASATLSYILALLTFPAAPPVPTHCLNALTNLSPHFMMHSNTHVLLHLCFLMFHVIMYHPIAIMSLLSISEAERTEKTRAKGEDGGCFRAGMVLIFTFVFLSFSLFFLFTAIILPDPSTRPHHLMPQLIPFHTFSWDTVWVALSCPHLLCFCKPLCSPPSLHVMQYLIHVILLFSAWCLCVVLPQAANICYHRWNCHLFTMVV